MSRTKKPARAPHYDLEYVRSAAAGQWVAILSTLGGIDPDLLDEQHHPCPKCGGTDRFRVVDATAGALICNACARTGIGDGFAALTWLTGKKFAEVLALVADYLGIQPTEQPTGKSSNKKAPPKPDEDLEFQPWDEATEMLVQVWCLWKPPITLAAIKAVGGRVARYSKRYNVIALPVWGPELDAAPAVGWVLYNLTGGELPRFAKNKQTGEWEVSEWLKVKLAAGSEPGIISDLSRLRSARVVVKTEGPSDALAALSMPDLPADYAVATNANGAKERPADWMVDVLAGSVDSPRKAAFVSHDADKPGQEGSIGWPDDRTGHLRPGWANVLATRCPTKNLCLPFPVQETHGQDLRDLLSQPAALFCDLQAIADATEWLPADKAMPAAPEPQVVLEHEDDPHYLARANLDNYQRIHGGVIKFWREQFYTWKPSRACYRVIQKDELFAKITRSIKCEFDRLWEEEYAAYREREKKRQETGDDTEEKIPKARKVTAHLVSNVINAMKSLSLLPSSVELNTWLDGEFREQRSYVAMLNGVIDIDKLLADADEDECILPHSPNWFSTVRLPYNFDPDAKCPKWDAFLRRNLEEDEDRIKLIQEWAGYCLTPDTSLQKFLAMQGDGGNGKSVFIAGLQAILGRDNCSHIGLERFTGDSFEAAETIGKLANFCADVGEIDKLAEGTLKSFTSGDVMSFKRKFLGNTTTTPTARMVMAFNSAPRFSDRSDGVWRRMLLIPWNVKISAAERVPGMDKPTWWEKEGELSGMFLWALVGLHRLRNQRRFTSSAVSDEAIEQYKRDTQPERMFLTEYMTPTESESQPLLLKTIYHFYCKWCVANNHRPLSKNVFGKSIKAVFPESGKKRFGKKENRGPEFHVGIAFSASSIFGEDVSSLNDF